MNVEREWVGDRQLTFLSRKRRSSTTGRTRYRPPTGSWTTPVRGRLDLRVSFSGSGSFGSNPPTNAITHQPANHSMYIPGMAALRLLDPERAHDLAIWALKNEFVPQVRLWI